ncbi:MAG: AAA family ATPase [Elusimicrobiota bacterium]|nr:MAG: AAA family ATPase [Elusimicrobiota bacterium]
MLAAVKALHGIGAAPAGGLRPLGAEHLTSTSAATSRLAIEKLTDAQNVNMLKPGETLGLSTNGLTLIYGANGSGKSGYTRIFKKACAARTAEDILANVFDRDYKTKPPATATFHLSLTAAGVETKKEVTWAANTDCPPELRQVRVFDRKAAAIYVEEEAALAFVPFNLDLLDKLSDLCERLKATLAAEIATLDTAYGASQNAIPARGDAQTIARSITASTTPEAIEGMSKWEPADDAKLASVAELLDSPGKAIAEVRARRTRCDGLLARIARIESALSQEKLGLLEEHCKLARETKQAADAASQKSFSTDPSLLPGVGGGPWKQLWEAARNYSTQAYPGMDYPVVADSGGKEPQCVLCHQPLSEDACKRFQGFEEFVRGDVANRARVAESARAEAVRVIEQVSAVLSPDDHALLSELQTDAPALAASIEPFIAAAVARKAAIMAAVPSGNFTTVPAEPAKCSTALKAHIDALDVKMKEIENSLTPERKAALKLEQTALITRKTLAEHKTTLLRLIENRAAKKKLDDCIKEVAVRAISEAKKKLNQLFVDDLFKKTLQEELDAVGVTRKVTLDFAVSKGIAYQKAIFGDSAFPNLDLVLSEGEHRAVAIACFLAEARMLGETQPLVIDDPVSSLDHIRRERLTRRIIAEARKRQVVIFTHDIVFWADVGRIAEENHVTVTLRDIRPEAGLCGKVGDGETPWVILPVANKLQYLEGTRLPELRALDANSQTYADRTKDVGGKLRDTWEQLIEENLFQDTLGRLRPNIKSQNLDKVKVLDEDWERIYHGMTRCSFWAHSTPVAAGTPPPSVDDLKKEIDEIRNLMTKLKADGNATRKARGERLSNPAVPPVALGATPPAAS